MADVHETAQGNFDSHHRDFVAAIDATRLAMQAIGVGADESVLAGHPETLRACDDTQAPTVKIIATDSDEGQTQQRYIITMGGLESKYHRTYKAILSIRVDSNGDTSIHEARAAVHYPRQDGDDYVVKRLNPLQAMRMGTIIAQRAQLQAQNKLRPDDTSEIPIVPPTVV